MVRHREILRLLSHTHMGKWTVFQRNSPAALQAYRIMRMALPFQFICYRGMSRSEERRVGKECM